MNSDATVKLTVTEIQRFCMHDGPGLRTTVFLKGCPLDCVWCHNPECKKPAPELLFYQKKCIGCGACSVCPRGAHTFTDKHEIDRSKCAACGICVKACPAGALQIAGRTMTVNEIVEAVVRDAAFYGDNGGVTLSGGEPLFQPGAVTLLRSLKEAGLNTAVETCGYVSPDVIKNAVPLVDTFLWDIKDTDSDRHEKYTGKPNGLIISNLRLADSYHAKIRLRFILVNGVNTDESHYRACAELYGSLSNPDKPEVIPYHAYGGVKSTFLGLPDGERKDFIPTDEQINKFKNILKI